MEFNLRITYRNIQDLRSAAATDQTWVIRTLHHITGIHAKTLEIKYRMSDIQHVKPAWRP